MGEERKVSLLTLSHLFKLFLSNLLNMPEKKIDITDIFVLVSLRISRPRSV